MWNSGRHHVLALPRRKKQRFSSSFAPVSEPYSNFISLCLHQYHTIENRTSRRTSSATFSTCSRLFLEETLKSASQDLAVD
ncbi:hypothetical protein BST61_g5653 [Cercospora zeina]